MKKLLLIPVLIILNVHIAFPRIIYVDAMHPSIQSAINQASEGDTVLILPGLYSENLILQKSILLSSSTYNPDVTISGTSGSKTLVIQSAGKPVINGLIFTGGSGITCDNTDVTVSNCIFTDCVTGMYEGILDLRGNFQTGRICEASVFDCEFRNNTADFGMITLAYNTYARIIGNILHNNSISSRASEKGMIDLAWGFNMGTVWAEIRNNVISGNAGNGILFGRYNDHHTSIINNIVSDNAYFGIYNMLSIDQNAILADCNVYIAYNNVFNNQSGNYRGSSNNGTDISADPAFVGTGNFRLQNGSPCINAGHPQIMDNDLTRSDIGAYGGSKTKLDVSPPNVYGCNPLRNQSSVNPSGLIAFRIRDNSAGVDSSSIELKIENQVVSRNITGSPSDYLVKYIPSVPFSWNQVVDVTINSKDLNVTSNVMKEVTYSFTIDAAPNNPPILPSNPIPANNTVSFRHNGNLYWGNGEPVPDDPDPGDAVTFHVYLEPNNPDPQQIFWTGVSPHERVYVGNLNPSTKYYWKVVAVDRDSAVTAGPVWNFTTEKNPVTVNPLIAIDTMLTPGPSPTGIAFDGKNLYITDSNTGLVYKQDYRSRTIIRSSNPFDTTGTVPISNYISDLAWDGRQLWMSEAKFGGPEIFKLDTLLKINSRGFGYQIEGLGSLYGQVFSGSSWEGRFYNITNPFERSELYDFGWQANIYGIDGYKGFLWVAIDNKIIKCLYDTVSVPGHPDVTPLEIATYPYIIGDLAWIDDTLLIASKNEGKIYRYVNPAVTDSTIRKTLESLYFSANGDQWKIRTNWMSNKPFSEWYGVTYSGGKLISLDLHNNNLSGKIPADIIKLTELKTFDISLNKVISIPDLSGLNLDTLLIQNNSLTFEDIENNINSGKKFINYSPQDSIGNTQMLAGRINRSIAFRISCEGSSNIYQWNKNNVPIPGASDSIYNLKRISMSDAGTYTCTVTNSLAKDLTLHSRKIYFSVMLKGRDKDSLALVSIYNSTGGSNWTTNTNWLSQEPINLWYGVTLGQNSGAKSISDSTSVLMLDLSSNNLQGTIPAQIGDMTGLLTLLLGSNSLSGSIPEEINNIPSLRTLDLSNNVLEDLPVFKFMALDTLRLEKNNFSFEDLIPVLSIPQKQILYQAQDSLGERIDTLCFQGGSLALFAGTDTIYNRYQWYKNGIPINGAIRNPFIISNIRYEDAGNYNCKIINAEVTGLTLYSRIAGLRVQSLTDDPGISFPGIRIYPNPSTGILYVEAKMFSGSADLEIFDFTGRKIFHSSLQNSRLNKIDISVLREGIYLLIIRDDSFRYEEKFIKR